MNEYDGKLVAIEGIDGSGKGTLIEQLKEELGEEEYVFTKEPSEGVYGQFVRERLSDNEATPADFYNFLADRYHHVDNVIEPALEDGKTVITDRYALSTYAYQSKVLDEELGIIDPMKYIDEMTYHFTIEPDVYLYIRIPVSRAIERITGDHRNVEKYENKDSLLEAKRVYDFASEDKENVITVPGIWDKEEVFRESLRWIEH